MPRRSSCSFSSLLPCVLASLFICACGSADEGEDTNAAEESTSQSSDETETETGTGDPVCFPEGFYGPCSGENMGCQCLLGADIYQVCTANCVDDSDCGDPADFPGATPGCFPVNPGAEQKVCSLVCTSTADCPCGLICQPTTSICAENQ
jgi:hypothetical protein